MKDIYSQKQVKASMLDKALYLLKFCRHCLQPEAIALMIKPSLIKLQLTIVH